MRFPIVVPRIAIATVVILDACKDATAPKSVPEPILAISSDSLAGVPILRLTVATPTLVRVDYWQDSTYILRVQDAVTTDDNLVALPRVRAGETYHYSVRTVGADGAFGAPVNGALTAPALPADLQQLGLAIVGSPTSALTMLEVNSAFKGYVAADGSGAVVWYWRTVNAPQGFTRRPNGNLVLNDPGNAITELSANGLVVNRLNTIDVGLQVHHDLVATTSGTILFLAKDLRTVNGTPIYGDAIYEWSPESGAVNKRWTVFDFYDPAVDWGDVSTPGDWVHANSLAIGPHGNIMLSLNWLNQVVSIAPDWKSLEWKLGGRGSSFAVDSDAVFLGQHNVQLISESHVLLFDNGRSRLPGNQYSRALELVLDPITHIAHRAWEFRASPDIFAPFIGSVHRLANGNTVVHFGLLAGRSGSTGPIATYEVEPSGHAVSALFTTNALSVYRGTPLTTIAGEMRIR
jgi:hypothetical protein